MNVKRLTLFAALALPPVVGVVAQAPASQQVAAPTVLSHAELEKFIPATVFFQGQTATVQMRNAAGVRFAPDFVTFAVKVDTGGYATSVQERYQDYLITESAVLIAGQPLPAGAYGAGFVAGQFLIMDLGGKQVLSVPSQTDSNLKRPMPLQMLPDSSAGTFRLYSGRTFVSFARAAR